MKKTRIQIIPAIPGCYAIYDLEEEKELQAMEVIIAWRIETYQRVNEVENYFSTSTPITINGDACKNCIGVLWPNKTAEEFDCDTYKSLVSWQEKKYGKKEIKEKLNEEINEERKE